MDQIKDCSIFKLYTILDDGGKGEAVEKFLNRRINPNTFAKGKYLKESDSGAFSVEYEEYGGEFE